MNKFKGINKKADLQEVMIFLLFGIVIFTMLFLGMTRVGSGASFYEQAYSKKIALIIDKAEVGMEIEIDVLDMLRIAEKDEFGGQILVVDNELNKVVVRLSDGKGYTFYFFNDIDVIWELRKDDANLYMKFVDSSIGGGVDG